VVVLQIGVVLKEGRWTVDHLRATEDWMDL
jgi:hypothetical protein